MDVSHAECASHAMHRTELRLTMSPGFILELKRMVVQRVWSAGVAYRWRTRSRNYKHVFIVVIGCHACKVGHPHMSAQTIDTIYIFEAGNRTVLFQRR